MLKMLPRNPERRAFTISQLLGIGTGAVLLLGMIAYVIITRSGAAY